MVASRTSPDRQVAEGPRRALGLGPWLAIVGVWLLFELPTIFRPAEISAAALRPSGDVLLLLTLWAVSRTIPRLRALRYLAFAWATLLVVYRLDQMIFMLLMRDEPLLYDQLFMIQHLLVLIQDLWSLRTLLVVEGITGAIALGVWAVGKCLRRAAPLLEPSALGRTGRVAAAAWVLVAISWASAASGLISRGWVRWVSPVVVANIGTSYQTFQAVQRGLSTSPYREYDHIQLKRKPHVLLFIVESYGRLLATHEDTKNHYEALLLGIQGALESTGWHMASAYSRSSVSGGRSWLADASLLLGTEVKYEAVFRHLVGHARTMPTLVSFLAQQGYETALLAPADRNRPGARVVNHYGFDRVLTHESLGYHGPQIGWGLIPDQWSLHVAHEKLAIAERTRPLFLNFHMVSSHAPWRAVPPLIENYKDLNDLSLDFWYEQEEDKPASTHVLRRMRRYRREENQSFSYMGGFTAPLRHGYERTVSYDLRLITRYLEALEGDVIAIVMGDHQPPVIARENASFDTPVHVIARDPSLLTELVDQGFTPGLNIPSDAPSAVAHAGLFSLLVRDLVRASGDGQRLPTFRRQGHSLFAPEQSQGTRLAQSSAQQ